MEILITDIHYNGLVYNYSARFYRCPHCSYNWLIVHEMKYCPDCGNKLKWEIKESGLHDDK